MTKKKLLALLIGAATLSSGLSLDLKASEIAGEQQPVAKLPKFYTEGEIQAGRVLAQSTTTLNDHHEVGQNIWFSVSEETYDYQGSNTQIPAVHQKYVLARMDYRTSDGDWNGDIALFPYTSTSLSEIYRAESMFNDFWGTPFDSTINFTYYPRRDGDLKPWVELRKSNAGYQQGGKGYNHFARRCFIDFVKEHTDAELIISDAHNHASSHVLSKPEFGFQDGKDNVDLAPYKIGMRCPYYLEIPR